MAPQIIIRSYTKADAAALAAIFYHTIHIINVRDYTLEQVNAWAPRTHLEAAGWEKKWEKLPPLVATLNNKIVGFAEFENTGHIDCFYCHHEHQGIGAGSALLTAIEEQAHAANIPRIYAEVSISAKPFFIARGFNVVKQQSVTIRGVNLTNFVMEKVFDNANS